MQAEAIAFLDESYYTKERFRSIALVTVAASEVERIRAELRKILAESGVEELKWQDLRTAKVRFAAAKIIEFILDEVIKGNVRIDVLIWDTHDKRHVITGRDDINNLERMIYHLVTTVATKRWKAGETWSLRPDEQTAIDFVSLSRIVERGNAKKTDDGDTPPQIIDTVQQRSHEEPLVQVADLFAGCGSYAKTNAEDILARRDGRPEALAKKQSNSERERFALIVGLLDACAKRGIRAAFVRAGLKTAIGSALDFWTYIPQGAYDHAPIKAASAKEQTFQCSVEGCESTISLTWVPKRPLCKTHFMAAKEEESDVELRRENALRQHMGSHHCPNCVTLHTPSQKELDEAEYIGRNPKCPHCKQWILEQLPRDGGIQPYGRV